MKLRIGFGVLSAAFVASFSVAGTADAAFVIEPNGKASSNFAAANATSDSIAALAPGLTDDAASVFGGEPYTYVYTPGADGDNTTFTSGTVLNGFANLNATGVPNGGAGLYNVYVTYPESGNNSDQPTIYTVDVDSDGTPEATDSYDQNIASLDTGRGIGLWELIGTVEVTDPLQQITVDISTTVPTDPFTGEPGTPGFVGARTAGVMFEAVPEPTSAVLLGLGGLGLLARRRRVSA